MYRPVESEGAEVRPHPWEKMRGCAASLEDEALFCLSGDFKKVKDKGRVTTFFACQTFYFNNCTHCLLKIRSDVLLYVIFKIEI